MCNVFSVENWAYIISLSFQLSGSLVVLIYNIGISRASIIKSFRSTAVIARDGETNEISDVTNAIKDRFRQAYVNSAAFVQLLVGYFVGLFAEKTDTEICSVLCAIAISTLVLLCLSLLIVRLCMRRDKVTRNITDEELKSYDIKPDIESLSKKEVDDIFEEVMDNLKF